MILCFMLSPPPPLVYVDQDITIADMSCFFALAHISELSVLSALI